MSEETVSVERIKSSCGVEEQMGFDAPFVTFTWAHWLEIQTRVVQCLTRYQRAIEQKEPLVALLIVLEMQQVGIDLHKEACTWVGVKERI